MTKIKVTEVSTKVCVIGLHELHEKSLLGLRDDNSV